MSFEGRFFSIPINGGPKSVVRVSDGNGYGSPGTFIRRFTTVHDYIGKDITYIDSGTTGAAFVINTNGVYNITYQDGRSASSCTFGITLNPIVSEMTAGIDSTANYRQLVNISTAGANSYSQASILVPLKAGDVIRAHAGSTSPDVTNSGCRFSICRAS